MNTKITFLLLGLLNLVFALFFYSKQTFPFSSIVLLITIIIVFEHLTYVYYNNPKSIKFNIFFISIVVLGLYETFIIQQGIIFKNLIIATSAIALIVVVKWTILSRKENLTPIFTIITSTILYFVLYSKIYTVTSFAIVIPWQVYMYNQRTETLKDELPYIREESKVLDIDGDKGLLLYHLNKETGCKVIGVDNSPNSEILNKAINLSSIYNNIDQVEIKNDFNLVTALKFADKKYDTNDFLNECSDLISTNGFLVLSTDQDKETKVLEESLELNDFKITRSFITNMSTDDNTSSVYTNNITQILSGAKINDQSKKKVKRRIIIAKRLPDKEIVDILKIGTTAVSPYNIQPWRFKIVNNIVYCYIVKDESILSNANPHIYSLTLGALINNIKEGAKFHGYSMDFDLLDSSIGLQEPNAKIIFNKNNQDDNQDDNLDNNQDYNNQDENRDYIKKSNKENIDHVLSRFTDRKIYRKDKIPELILAEALNLFKTDSSYGVAVDDLEAFAETYSEMERMRFKNDILMIDTHYHMRYGQIENLKEKDLMDIRTTEASKVNQIFLELYGKSGFHFFLKHIKGLIDFKAKDYQKDLLLNSANMLLYYEDDFSYSNLVRDGMNLQNILNYLEKNKVHSHMLPSSLDVLNVSIDIFKGKEKIIVNNLRKEFNELINNDYKKIVMVLRVGYGDDSKVRALRKRVKDLLVN